VIHTFANVYCHHLCRYCWPWPWARHWARVSQQNWHYIFQEAVKNEMKWWEPTRELGLKTLNDLALPQSQCISTWLYLTTCCAKWLSQEEMRSPKSRGWYGYKLSLAKGVSRPWGVPWRRTYVTKLLGDTLATIKQNVLWRWWATYRWSNSWTKVLSAACKIRRRWMSRALQTPNSNSCMISKRNITNKLNPRGESLSENVFCNEPLTVSFLLGGMHGLVHWWMLGQVTPVARVLPHFLYRRHSTSHR